MAEVNNNGENIIEKKLAPMEQHGQRILLKLMLDSGASSFGKAFIMYAIPVSLIQRGSITKSTLTRASAIASFMGMAKAAQIYLYQNQSHPLLKYYSQAIAGALGAAIALSVDRGLCSTTLVIWITIRALRCLMEESKILSYIQNIPGMSTIIMCLSAAQILSSWTRYPKELAPSYKRFLDYQGGRSLLLLSKLYKPNLPITEPRYIFVPAEKSLITDTFQYMKGGLTRAAKLYAPLYLIQLIYNLASPKNYHFDKIVKALRNFVINIIRSSLFLSSYCAIAWVSVFANPVYWNPANRGATRVNLRRSLWLSGLPTLLERQERRPELAHYCATYAIDSIITRFLNRFPDSKSTWKSISSLLLILSCGVLLHHHNKQPAVVTKWVLGFNSTPVNNDNNDNTNEVKVDPIQ